MQGDANSFDYRVFVQESGQPVSVWHDIPLYTDDGLLNMVVEIPKESSAKMEAATVSFYIHGPSFTLIMLTTSYNIEALSDSKIL